MYIIFFSSLKWLYELAEVVPFSIDDDPEEGEHREGIEVNPVPEPAPAESKHLEEELELAEEEVHHESHKHYSYFEPLGLNRNTVTYSIILASIRSLISFRMLYTLSSVAVVSSSSLRKFIIFYRYF